MNFEELKKPEFKEKLDALVKDEGLELPADELEKIAAGGDWKNMVTCRRCGREYDRLQYGACPHCGCEESNPL